VKAFKTIAVVKHPREAVWIAMRDRLPDLVRLLSDIEAVESQARDEDPDGVVRLVNLWRARAQVPAALAPVVTPEMLAWTDQAEWRPDAWECRWQIQPRFLTGGVRCAGVTRYAEAMAGRGTRLTFEGSLDVSTTGLPGGVALLGGATGRAIEAFATGLIPRNFQKLAHAVDRYLEAGPS
jgi:hypothetical protein